MNHSIKVFLLIFLFLLLPIFNEGALENHNSQAGTLSFNKDSIVTNVRKSTLKTSSSSAVYCTGNFSDIGEDLDGDLLLDHVVLFVEIEVTQYFPNLTIDLFIQPLIPGESPTPIGTLLKVSTVQTMMDIGIHNVSISIVNASIFHAFEQDLMFHIQEIYIKRSHDLGLYLITVFSASNVYTSRVYSNNDFDFFIIFTGQIWDKGEDTDFNWRYDYLIIEVEVEILQKGEYLVITRLALKSGDTGKSLTSSNRSYLEMGVNVFSIRFDAASLRKFQINDSLVVTNIKFYDKANILIGQVHPDYVTQVYFYTDFDIHEININGNEEFTFFANNEKIQGDGSPSNPYIITGITIKGSAPRNLIQIENVDVSFQITNFILNGGKTAIFLQNLTHCLIANNNLHNNRIGVYLNNVNGCIIRHNTITGHDEGIFLFHADRNLIDCNSLDKNIYGIFTYSSNNNVIANNSISGISYIKRTDDIGILIGTNSQENLIINNDFQNNIFNSYDLGLNNTYMSNYWANWIGEGYYWIPGEYDGSFTSSKNVDPSPSIIPNNLVKPIIISPLGETFLDPVIVIKWVAYDPLGLGLTYNIYFSINGQIGHNWILVRAGITKSHFEWNVRNVAEGYYQIKIVVYDSLGFSSWSVSDWFIIQTPLNPTPVISPLFGTIILILICVALLRKFISI